MTCDFISGANIGDLMESTGEITRQDAPALPARGDNDSWPDGDDFSGVLMRVGRKAI